MKRPEPLDVWTPKFEEGCKVYKHGSGYSGPGTVACSWRGKDGHVRYVVEHRIEDGEGWFFHIYGEGQLLRIPDKMAVDEDLADQITRQINEELNHGREPVDRAARGSGQDAAQIPVPPAQSEGADE